jgi:diguanylate cyclase (GGDEF)-like protein
MNRNILIADDDPAIRALVRGFLADRHTTVTEACDGEAAVLMAARCRPDAVLLDMDMPRMSGFDVCRRLKSDPLTRRIPVLFLTAEADPPAKVRGIDMGAADYITKPFDTDELRARVRSAVRFHGELRTADQRAARDEVTGLFNRAYLDQRLEADLAASRRRGQPLACCVATVGGGDDGGPLAAGGPAQGEAVMRRAARAILSVLRREDVACLYDDRTFAVLAFTANGAASTQLARRVQDAVATALPSPDGGPAIPVHVGVALSHYSIGDSLLWHATEAMRHARLNAPGTVQFGGELTELQLTDRSVN